MIRAHTSTRSLVLRSPVLLLMTLSWITVTLIGPGSIPSINLAPVAGSSVASAAPSRPNIITVMTDDQTVTDMQIMSHVKSLIGAHGVTFNNSFVSYSMCCPSRATYFTGQYA